MRHQTGSDKNILTYAVLELHSFSSGWKWLFLTAVWQNEEGALDLPGSPEPATVFILPYWPEHTELHWDACRPPF